MNQIYVVQSQGSYLMDKKPMPIAAFMDYPSALTYAQSIFKSRVGSQENPRDLIFLLTVTQTTTTGTPPTTPTIAATTPAVTVSGISTANTPPVGGK